MFQLVYTYLWIQCFKLGQWLMQHGSKCCKSVFSVSIKDARSMSEPWSSHSGTEGNQPGVFSCGLWKRTTTGRHTPWKKITSMGRRRWGRRLVLVEVGVSGCGDLRRRAPGQWKGRAGGHWRSFCAWKVSSTHSALCSLCSALQTWQPSLQIQLYSRCSGEVHPSCGLYWNCGQVSWPKRSICWEISIQVHKTLFTELL